jgi:hypothetical protein
MKTAKDGLQPITILDGLHASKEFCLSNSSKNGADDVR